MENAVIKDHAKESSHWYDRQGNPCYTIIGKNGKERPTTLRDARSTGLLPSVTSIIRCAASPGLELWKSQQVLMAALTITRLENEPEDKYIERIVKDSQEQAAKARERGTWIHAVVQSGFENIPIQKDDYIYYESAKTEVDRACGGEQSWVCEKPFAAKRYGGKIDMHSPDFVIDIKTTEKDLISIKTWDEHSMQLAAYSNAISGMLLRCGILYINVLTAESKMIWIEENELLKGWKCFNALLDFYYAKTGLEV